MAETRAAFRLRVARMVGAVDEYTTTAAGASDGSTVAIDALLDEYPSDTGSVYVWDNTQEEMRRVVEYEPVEAVLAVNRPFTAQVADDTVVYLFKRFTPADYNRALRTAIHDAYPYLARSVVDTSLTVLADTYEYNIPSTIEDLERMMGGKVWMQVNSDVATYPYAELKMWTTRRQNDASAESYKLVIHPDEHIVGRVLRLQGLGPLTFPATDAATIPLPSQALNLLAHLTAAHLYAQTRGDAHGDTTHAQQQEAYFRGMYEQRKDIDGLLLDPTDLRDVNGGLFIPDALAYHTWDN